MAKLRRASSLFQACAIGASKARKAGKGRKGQAAACSAEIANWYRGKKSPRKLIQRLRK